MASIEDVSFDRWQVGRDAAPDPGARVDLIERCSGHGGTFGVMKETRPLARTHMGELVKAETIAGAGAPPILGHPIEVFARAYGVK